MKVRKFAAIDIGSNAIRLLIQNVMEEGKQEPKFRKSALIRIPVRLGEDAFTKGKISDYHSDRMLKTMKAFQLLMEVHGVEKYMACATSAMREASNGSEIIERIHRESGIRITIINGKQEAAIIASTDLKELIERDRAYLYIDVGGGSTEFTVFTRGKIQVSKSFKIGTVRLLNKMVTDATWEQLEAWIAEHTGELSPISIIGSGGNINKLHKMSGRKEGEPLSYIWLNAQYRFLESMSYEDRLLELGLNPDRADVIIPAARIYLSAAKWSGAKKIHVPKIGLSDGMIKTLYHLGDDWLNKMQ